MSEPILLLETDDVDVGKTCPECDVDLKPAESWLDVLGDKVLCPRCGTVCTVEHDTNMDDDLWFWLEPYREPKQE